MIHCKLHGRLGNNLFNIATGLSMADKLDTQLTVGRTSLAGHRGTIPVDLSLFKHNFLQIDTPNLDNVYNEPYLHYSPIEIQNNTILSGVFGSWKYFEDIKEQLCSKYFTPSNQVLDNLTKYNVSPNALGISVRRGDFLMLQNNHCVLTMDYYQEVLDTYFSDNTDSIYIFSDDFEWCRSIFGSSVNYVEDTVGTQLFLMTKMKHLIMANSTFSWWGAYLNLNGGIVVAPDPWLGAAYDAENTSDLYYPSWIKHQHIRTFQQYSIDNNFYN